MLSEKIRIVPMGAEHLEDIAALEGLCFSRPWSVKALKEELSNEQAHFLVAVVGDKTAGYIGVLEICGEGYITNVAVFPEHRRQGIASALLETAADGARRRGCAFLTLEVRTDNTAAVSLYQTHRFELAGTRKNFYEAPVEDALIMTLTLITENKNGKNNY